VDASPVVACTPVSGSLFALGTSTVNCTATDTSGNSSSGSFKVTVKDTTAPVLSLPADQTFEGNTTGGYNGAYLGATATDVVDAAPVVACVPASPNFFALGGPHTVNCTAKDASGNTATGSFTVTVQDTKPPTLSGVPGPISATATSVLGATVNYAAPTATDIVDPAPTVSCLPVSGSTFVPGITTVTCTATDASGNISAPQSFTVTVNFAWSGFFAPIDTGKTLNQMKGGSTAPIKWNVSNPLGGYISDLSIVAKAYSGVMVCDNMAPLDNLETYATGGTSLRYDFTNNQFIYNWQSPKAPGLCYQVQIVLTDRSVHIAQFKLK
jgi:hypothetical protein